jgi:DNA modification methylase
MSCRILVGDCREQMAGMEPSSVDAIVTDPPYGLEFMGKEWDAPWKYGFSEMGIDGHRKPSPSFGSSRNPMCRVCRKHQRGTERCLCEAPSFDERPADSNILFQQWCEGWAGDTIRVLKPGAHLLAFGGTRTHHRMMTAIEDAGFEIRDCLMWLYGSGFPKSLNLHGEWEGWGTALKPGWEPIILARKPLRGTVAANVTAHGTGALNIDGCRIGNDGGHAYVGRREGQTGETVAVNGDGLNGKVTELVDGLGRWPANVVLDEDAATLLDAGTGITIGGNPTSRRVRGGIFGPSEDGVPCGPQYGDRGGVSRYFYCAKADRAERNIGLAGMPERLTHRYSPKGQGPLPQQTPSTGTVEGNYHPTVKPVALMQWLVRLVTPPGGTVLDPFMGSGTTGIACGREGFGFVGIEMSEEYAEIARRRIYGDAPLFADVEMPA